MGGKRKNRKKKKPQHPRAPGIRVVNETQGHEAKCQEHPDRESEATVKEKDPPPTHHRRFPLAFAALLISILSLIVFMVQAYYMRQTMRMDQRPWVFQDLIQAPTTAKATEPIAVDFEMVNVGKTIALNVTAIIHIGKVNYVGPVSFSSENSSVYSRVQGVLPQTVHTRNYPPIVWEHPIGNTQTPLPSDADVNDLNSGKSFIRIWGEIKYKDVFGTSHSTKFCDWKYLGPIPTIITNVTECVNENDVDTNF